jgi:hypothetical protein
LVAVNVDDVGLHVFGHGLVPLLHCKLIFSLRKAKKRKKGVVL